MTEFPGRSCGACEKHSYQRVADTHGDYITNNTVPKPELVHRENIDVSDRHTHGHLSVPGTYNRPDLLASPIKEREVVKPPLGFEGLPEVPPKSQTDPCCCATGNSQKHEPVCNADSIYARKHYGNPALDIPIQSMEENINTTHNVHIRDQVPKHEPEPHVLKGILKKTAEPAKPCPCIDSVQQGINQPNQRPDIFPLKKINQPEKKPEEEAGESSGNRACYMPQPEDAFPDLTSTESSGAWATGRVDWSPLAGLTGIRPVVNKYSIARFSESEWRSRNKEVLDSIWDAAHRANMLEFNSKSAIYSVCTAADRNQADSTKRLIQREQELHRYKCELERAITASDEELTNLIEARRRLKHSMAVLMMPESIASESLERRTGRLDPELVRDEVEEELIKERALTSEIREQFLRALADMEHQLIENKTAKSRLENDWSDKNETNAMEAINVALNNRSTVLLFKPGAVGFPDNQSTQELWEKFTRETLEESEQTRQRSVALRGTLESISKNAAISLRAQADKVENALQKRINCMEEMRTRLENELIANLKQVADIETTMNNIRDTVRRLDVPLKCAQTRLDNRIMHRPRVENCRDAAHYGLVEEVKAINDDVSALMSQLRQAEIIQRDLMGTRGKLEKELYMKKKTLEIDRDRIQRIRSYYPSGSALQGY